MHRQAPDVSAVLHRVTGRQVSIPARNARTVARDNQTRKTESEASVGRGPLQASVGGGPSAGGYEDESDRYNECQRSEYDASHRFPPIDHTENNCRANGTRS